jgi:hypothetical protein
MYLLAKYGTQTTFTFTVVKRSAVDLAATGDWTPATGDSKISKDGGNVANVTNNPTAVGGTGSVLWTITLEATELQAAVVDLQIVDSATKAIEDQHIKIYTYGNASAKIQADLSDTVRLGLTALPNAAAAATGGLPTVDASNAVKIRTGQIVPKKNTAFTAFPFFMQDASDHLSGKTGLTVTATRSIDGGAFGPSANSATEIGNGWYKINLAASDVNGDIIIFHFAATGADNTDLAVPTQP